jgi:hypothetical protein
MIDAVRTAIVERITTINTTIINLQAEQDALLAEIDEARKAAKRSTPSDTPRKKRKYTMTKRSSPNRDLVFNYLLTHNRPMAPQAIATALDGKINRNSIYSTLAGLENTGRVERTADAHEYVVTEAARKTAQIERTRTAERSERNVRIHIPGH